MPKCKINAKVEGNVQTSIYIYIFSQLWITKCLTLGFEDQGHDKQVLDTSQSVFETLVACMKKWNDTMS